MHCRITPNVVTAGLHSEIGVQQHTADTGDVFFLKQRDHIFGPAVGLQFSVIVQKDQHITSGLTGAQIALAGKIKPGLIAHRQTLEAMMLNELACLANIIPMVEYQHNLHLWRFGAGGVLQWQRPADRLQAVIQ